MDRKGKPYTVMFASILYAQLSGHKFRERSFSPSLPLSLYNARMSQEWNKRVSPPSRRGNICRPSQIIPPSFFPFFLSLTDRKLGTSRPSGVTADYSKLKTRPNGQAIAAPRGDHFSLPFVSSRVTGRHAGH